MNAQALDARTLLFSKKYKKKTEKRRSTTYKIESENNIIVEIKKNYG